MREFFEILKEDYKLNSFRSFLILFFYRILNRTYKYKLLHFFILAIYHILKIILQINCQISYKAHIGRRIRFPHVAFGVVISAKAKIGNDVTIFHLVTIGINEKKCNNDNICVEIGDKCYIGAGAKIISAKIGSNCKIGANAIVYKDIASDSIVVSKVEIK